ncbi:MAG: hypothetical protein CMJ83_03925 [Planctomycetes bacterium]|nr:hypothetical protein [Planctomycetota bacterium]
MSMLLPGLLMTVLVSASPPARLGEEAFGNDPVNKHSEWVKGVVDAANDRRRVYRRWVNGNEDFCFRGDAIAVNAALKLFAKIDDPKKLVVLLPDLGRTRSFENVLVKYVWKINVPSGIYLGMAKRVKGPSAMHLHPVMEIHLTGGLKAEELELPAGLAVVGAEDLMRKYRDARKNGETASTRGYGCHSLWRFGYGAGVVEELTTSINSEDSFVQLSAVGALGLMGQDARTAVPALKKLMGAAEVRLRDACKRALDKISKAKPAPKSDLRVGTMKAIRKVLDGRKKR